MKKNILSIVAVLFVLAIASVSAYHMSGSSLSNQRTGYDATTGERVVVVDSDRSTDCDVNQYDSIDTCASNIDGTRNSEMNTVSDRNTVSDTWSERTTVSDVDAEATDASTWLVLRCRVADESSTVSDTSYRQTTSDTGRTSSTFGRSTAGNSSNGSSNSNVFDRQNTADQSGSWTGGSRSSWTSNNRVNTADMQMLECYVTDSTETMSFTGASGDTRGFESPVVYSGTLNTQRTADNVDANDAVAESDAGNAGTAGRTTVSDRSGSSVAD